jgi:hypothetical protein
VPWSRRLLQRVAGWPGRNARIAAVMDDLPVVGAVPDRAHIGMICVPRASSTWLLDTRFCR